MISRKNGSVMPSIAAQRKYNARTDRFGTPTAAILGCAAPVVRPHKRLFEG